MSASEQSLGEKRRPLIAVATFVWNREGTKILMAERLAGRLQGYWNLPGGHLEWMESPAQGAQREVKEEVGVEVNSLSALDFGYAEAPEEDHCYVVLFHCGIICEDAVIQNPEPKKNGPWVWQDMRELPAKTLQPILNTRRRAQEWIEQMSMS